jgi:hypothetical protein
VIAFPPKVFFNSVPSTLHKALSHSESLSTDFPTKASLKGPDTFFTAVKTPLPKYLD